MLRLSDRSQLKRERTSSSPAAEAQNIGAMKTELRAVIAVVAIVLTEHCVVVV